MVWHYSGKVTPEKNAKTGPIWCTVTRETDAMRHDGTHWTLSNITKHYGIAGSQGVLNWTLSNIIMVSRGLWGALTWALFKITMVSRGLRGFSIEYPPLPNPHQLCRETPVSLRSVFAVFLFCPSPKLLLSDIYYIIRNKISLMILGIWPKIRLYIPLPDWLGTKWKFVWFKSIRKQ